MSLIIACNQDGRIQSGGPVLVGCPEKKGDK